MFNTAYRTFGLTGRKFDRSASPVDRISDGLYSQQAFNMPYTYPGGVVGVHQHARRPGVLYMLEGELVEVRNDSKTPFQRGVGDVSFEKGGVIHWWRNDSGAEAIALVVDIVPESMN